MDLEQTDISRLKAAMEIARCGYPADTSLQMPYRNYKLLLQCQCSTDISPDSIGFHLYGKGNMTGKETYFYPLGGDGVQILGAPGIEGAWMGSNLQPVN